MGSSNDRQINPTVVGWVVGFAVVGLGIVGIGIPLRTRLQEAGASTIVANMGLVAGAFVGLVVLFVGLWAFNRRYGARRNQQSVSELFEDDSDRDRD